MTDNCQNNWPTCFISCQVTKYKNRWRNCFNLKEMKELWHAIWDWTLDQRKNTTGKTVKNFPKGMWISQVDKLRPAGHLLLWVKFLKHSHYHSCVVYSCSCTTTQVSSSYGDPTDNQAKHVFRKSVLNSGLNKQYRLKGNFMILIIALLSFKNC